MLRRASAYGKSNVRSYIGRGHKRLRSRALVFNGRGPVLPRSVLRKNVAAELPFQEEAENEKEQENPEGPLPPAPFGFDDWEAFSRRIEQMVFALVAGLSPGGRPPLPEQPWGPWQTPGGGQPRLLRGETAGNRTSTPRQWSIEGYGGGSTGMFSNDKQYELFQALRGRPYTPEPLAPSRVN